MLTREHKCARVRCRKVDSNPHGVAPKADPRHKHDGHLREEMAAVETVLSTKVVPY